MRAQCACGAKFRFWNFFEFFLNFFLDSKNSKNGISGAPPGDNYNHQEASRKYQKPPRSLWNLLAIIKNPWKTGGVLAPQVFWGRMGCSGGYILGRFTAVGPLIVATVRTRCTHGVRAALRPSGFCPLEKPSGGKHWPLPHHSRALGGGRGGCSGQQRGGGGIPFNHGPRVRLDVHRICSEFVRAREAGGPSKVPAKGPDFSFLSRMVAKVVGLRCPATAKQYSRDAVVVHWAARGPSQGTLVAAGHRHTLPDQPELHNAILSSGQAYIRTVMGGAPPPWIDDEHEGGFMSPTAVPLACGTTAQPNTK